MAHLGYECNPLILEIAELLDIPRWKAREVYMTIVKVMRDALLRGDYVKVNYFGTFKVKPVTKISANNLGLKNFRLRKKKVRFKPTEALKAFVNKGLNDN